MKELNKPAKLAFPTSNNLKFWQLPPPALGRQINLNKHFMTKKTVPGRDLASLCIDKYVKLLQKAHNLASN